MKELSIEEKAKRYDGAKINGSRLWECGEITRANYEYMFPEIKESEDEIWIDRACMLLDELNHLSTLTLAKIPSNVNDIIGHLKSLKDRVQPKQEWSEDNEEILNLIIARLHSHPNVEAEEYDKDYHWLKSLKPQNRWKPSDEQLEAVRIAAEVGTANNSWAMDVLKCVYQYLKKLREE